MKRIVILLALVVGMTLTAEGQNDTIVTYGADLEVAPSLLGAEKSETGVEVDTLKRFDVGMWVGGGVSASNAASAFFTGVSPRVVFRPSERLTIKASGTLLDSYSLTGGDYGVRGREVRSLAPYRNVDHVAGMLDLSVTYKVNERLWVAASLLRWSGRLAGGMSWNPWFNNLMAMELDATAFSAAVRYKTKNGNYLDFHMTVVDDRAGTLMPLMLGYPYGYGSMYHSTVFGGSMF